MQMMLCPRPRQGIDALVTGTVEADWTIEDGLQKRESTKYRVQSYRTEYAPDSRFRSPSVIAHHDMSLALVLLSSPHSYANIYWL